MWHQATTLFLLVLRPWMLAFIPPSLSALGPTTFPSDYSNTYRGAFPSFRNNMADHILKSDTQMNYEIIRVPGSGPGGTGRWECDSSSR